MPTASLADSRGASARNPFCAPPSPPPPPQDDNDAGVARSRQVLRLVGYNLLTATFLLIPIELGLRVFDFEPFSPPRVEFADPNPRQLADLVVDSDVLRTLPGYRAWVAAARDWRPSIVFMGDSCTDYGRYHEELRSMVAARDPDSLFTFVNAGVASWSSYSGLQQLQRDVLPMRPRAVTIYYGWNDHGRNFGLEDKTAARLMAKQSELRIVRLANNAVLASIRRFGDAGPYRVSLADFSANLRRMVHIARAEGIVPILLTAPTSYRRGWVPAGIGDRLLANPENLVPLHKRYVRAVRQVAAQENAPLIDLYKQLDQLPQRDLERLFTDGIHLSREGDRKIAELIDQYLVEANLWPRIMGPTFSAELEGRLQETLGNARLLVSGSFDVWLDGDRLLYVKDRCDDIEERFFLHVVPMDPDDLPQSRRAYGFDNLDFDLRRCAGKKVCDVLWGRLDYMPRCVGMRPLPDYPISAIRTGQFQCTNQNDCRRSWEGEFHFAGA